jgi:single-strand DNA-binding protein
MFQVSILVGNLGQDPELKTLPGGTVLCNFTLATNERRGDKDETTWHNITVFGKQAEAVAKYKKKGDAVVVMGRTSHSTYEKKDGSKGYSTKVIAERVAFISTKTNGQAVVTETHAEPTDPDLADIPF